MSSSEPLQIHGDINRITIPGINALGDLEDAVLRLVWEATPPVTVSDIHRRYWNETRPVAYTTIMTTLNRLAQKGILERTPNPAGQGYVYTPRKTRATLYAEYARQLTQLAYTLDPQATIDTINQQKGGSSPTPSRP